MGCNNSKNKYALRNQPHNEFLTSISNPPPWLATPLVALPPTKLPTGSAFLQKQLLTQPATSTDMSDFTKVRVLGRGKFGEVTINKNTIDGKFYAVKSILKSTIFVRKMKDSVEQEILTMMKVRHPFILHIFGYSQNQTHVCLIVEFCLGGELFNRLRRSNKFSENEALFYFSEVAIALNFLHSKPLEIVYRDLKPENIMLDHLGHVKLIDFGFAKAMNNGEILGKNCGTAMYIAPEIASGHKNVPHGFPVDWWALGVLLFEMLVGQAPFGDSSDTPKFEILSNINAGKIKYPSSIKKYAKIVIQGLLTPDTKARFSFAQVVDTEFMKGVNLDDLCTKNTKPPWTPALVEDVPNVSNFLDWKEKKKILLDQEKKEVTSYESTGAEGSSYSKIENQLWGRVGAGRVAFCKSYESRRNKEFEGVVGVGAGAGAGAGGEGGGGGKLNRKRSTSKDSNLSGSGGSDRFSHEDSQSHSHSFANKASAISKMKAKMKQKGGGNSPRKENRSVIKKPAMSIPNHGFASNASAINLAKRKAKSIKAKQVHP